MNLMTAIRANVVVDVLTERTRQISVKGFDEEHDDVEHDEGQLPLAAAAYAMAAGGFWNEHDIQRPFQPWPWDARWWKPSTPRRMLVKAAALIIAEIERLDRKSQQEIK